MSDLAESVSVAMASVVIELQDSAVADLALKYAEQIDMGGDLSKLGPPLLAALEALRMSPRARAAAMKGDKPRGNPIQSLRDKYQG
jgi:hypothetical protein